jgi:hypothetical protein
MTGPEHHLEAERLIAMARESHHADLYGHESDVQSALILADAQVHATLALADAITARTTGAGSHASDESVLGPGHAIPKSAPQDGSGHAGTRDCPEG